MIICLHNVCEKPHNEWEISPKMLEMMRFHPGTVLHFDDAREGVYQFALPILKDKIKNGLKVVLFVVPDWIEGKVQEHEQYSGFLKWDQIKELEEAGFEIGSHSLSHLNLTTLEEDDVELQVSWSKKTIEEKIGCKVTKFSYPYGKYNQLVISKVRKYYQEAYGLDEPEHKNKYNFPRKLLVNEEFSQASIR